MVCASVALQGVGGGEVPSADTLCTGSRELRGRALLIRTQLLTATVR